MISSPSDGASPSGSSSNSDSTWDCYRCSYRNDSPSKECHMCEAPRLGSRPSTVLSNSRKYKLQWKRGTLTFAFATRKLGVSHPVVSNSFVFRCVSCNFHVIRKPSDVFVLSVITPILYFYFSGKQQLAERLVMPQVLATQCGVDSCLR